MEHTYIPLTPTPTSLPPILLPPHPSRHSPVLFCPTLSCTSWHILLIYLSWSTTGVRWARWRMRRSGTFSPFKLSSKTGSGCSRNKPLRVMTPWSKPRDKWGQRWVWVFTALHCSTYCTALLCIPLLYLPLDVILLILIPNLIVHLMATHTSWGNLSTTRES